MNKLLIITGPTATGKTSLGSEIAGKFNGEIISADSRQVYKYMDIGTGKATDNFEWGKDLVEPDQQYSVSEWVTYATATIQDIWRRGKLPIVIGGTGQYIKELVRPSETLHIPPNTKLRAKLLNCSIVELQQELKLVSVQKWEGMNDSDKNNPRRLIRAIEVATQNQKSKVKNQKYDLKLNTPNILVIGLTAPLEYLYTNIDKRVEQRLVAGMEKEREALKKYHLPRTLGYNGESAYEWKLAEHQYAKRQLDYMKKFLPETIWFDISVDNWKDRLWPTIKNTLNI